MAPNGIIGDGTPHDVFVLNKSGLAPKVAGFVKPNGDPYVIYGDPAYGIACMLETSSLPFGEPILQINKKISIVQ